MKKKNPLMRARFAVACATILVSATGVKSAAAQTQVVVTNTGAQAVPVYGAVLTTQQADPVQIDLYVGFGPSDVAPKASYDLPAGKRLTIEHISSHCKSNYSANQDFVLRLGTGPDKMFERFMVNAKTFIYPSYGITLFGMASMPFKGIFDSGPIWADGIRSTNFGAITSCTVSLFGYLTSVQPQLAR